MAAGGKDLEMEMEEAQQLIHSSVSENTLKGYKRCWEDFVTHCKIGNQEPYQCDVPFVMRYLVKKGKQQTRQTSEQTIQMTALFFREKLRIQPPICLSVGH